jgi:hypothetical protein
MNYQMKLPIELAQASRYDITETKLGFEINCPDKPTVLVELDQFGILVSAEILMPKRTLDFEAGLVSLEKGDDVAMIEVKHSLYEFRNLLKCITQALMSGWIPPRSTHKPSQPRKTATLDLYQWSVLRAWAEAQTTLALKGRIYAQWKRLLDLAGPTPCAVQRSIFATCFARRNSSIWSRPWLWPLPEHDSALYTYPHRRLVSDILQYRAAAIAVHHWGQFESLHNCAEWDTDGYPVTIDNTQLLEQLANWRGLYSPTGQAYPNLNATLERLPGGLSPSTVPLLRTVMLRRPICDRLELSLLLGTIDASESSVPRNLHVFLSANRAQVVQAMERIAAYMQRALRPNRVGDIRALARLLNEYPGEHFGGLVSLTDQAIEWDREFHRKVDLTIAFLALLSG